MNRDLFYTLASTGFAVAFLHAAIPTHWLPFVLTGRAQGWTRTRTMAVTALAGGGHVLFTAVLGVFVAGFGIAVDRWMGQVFPYIAAAVLFLLGAYYLSRQAAGTGHGHSHFGAGHDHGHDHGHEHPHDAEAVDARSERPPSGLHRHRATDHTATASGTPSIELATPAEPAASTVPPRRTDRMAIIGLVSALMFSPCEGFLPVFLSGVRFGWLGFALLSITLATATLAGMLTFTWLTLAGLERFKLAALERYEQGILGVLLCVLGILVIVLET